jgi:hypothetical protein
MAGALERRVLDVAKWLLPAIPNYPFFGLAGRHFLPLLSLNPELKADFPF